MKLKQHNKFEELIFLPNFLKKFLRKQKCLKKKWVPLKVADAYISSEDAYYFQRSPCAFDAIFQYYATRVIHRPPELCPAAFMSELEFWGISHQSIGSCCVDVVTRDRLDEREEEKVYNDFINI